MMSWKRELFTCGCALLLAASPGCTKNQFFAHSEEIVTKGLCELPEDLSAFEAWLYDRFGGEISGSDVETLKKEMEISFIENKTLDLWYSRTEEVRAVWLIKKCIAPDNVSYSFEVIVETDLSGKAIISQAFLNYSKEDILAGKRNFSFDNSRRAARKDLTEMLSKKTVGLMNRAQVEEYMMSLGCSRLESSYSGGASFAFGYKIELEKDLPSRLLAYDFSIRVQVYLDSEDIVEKINAVF